MKYFLLVIALLSTSINQATVLIITHAFNRPDFIVMQDKLFKKFLKEPYRYVVFNDANNAQNCATIEKTCQDLGIECRRIPQEIHDMPYLPRMYAHEMNPAIRHAESVQYSLNTFGFDHNGMVLIIDSDMFLVRAFSIEDYMKNYDIAAIMRGTGKDIIYLWPGLCMLALNRMPNVRELNFNRGFVNGEPADVGGWSYYYLQKYPSLRVHTIRERWSYELGCNHDHVPKNHILSFDAQEQRELLTSYGFNEHEIQFLSQRPDTFEFSCDNHFFHYRAGSNYDNHPPEHIRKKTMLIQDYFNTILQ